MRKILMVVLCFVLVFTMVGCGNNANQTDVAVDTAGNVIEENSKVVLEGKNTTTVVDLEKGSVDEYDNEEYKELVGDFELPFEGEMLFYTESKDGSWNNAMTLKDDGSFYGSYYELNKTLTGVNYQNGTYYWNEYWGDVVDILWLDEHTFSMKIESLATEHDKGVERLEDDSFKSITTLDMKGISKDVEFILFMPSTPINMLPENIDEIINKDLSNQDSLGMYVLWNTEEQIAFWSEL